MKMMVDNEPNCEAASADTKKAYSESLISSNQPIKPKVLDVIKSSSTSAVIGNTTATTQPVLGNLLQIQQNSKEDRQPSLFGSNNSQPQTSTSFGGGSPSKSSGNLASTQPEFAITHPQPSTSTLFKQSSAKSASVSTTTPLGFGSQSAISSFGQPASSTNSTRFGHFGQSLVPDKSVFGQPINSGNFEQNFGPAKSIFGQPINHGNFGQSLVPAKSVFSQPINSCNFGQSFGPAKSVFGQPINPVMSISRYQPTFALDNLMDTSIWQSNYLWGMYHCITAMKEYESKSLEELRMEHYLAIGKLPKVGFGEFGTTNQPTVAAGHFITTSQPFPVSFGQSVIRPNENNLLFEILNNLGFGQTSFASVPQLFRAKPTFGQTAFGQTENAFNSNTSHGGNFVLSHTVLYLNN